MAVNARRIDEHPMYQHRPSALRHESSSRQARRSINLRRIMPFRRTLGALVLAAFVLAGCNKTADKGKTEDGLVEQGFTKDQAKCITDDVWDKIPENDRDKLTDKDATLTPDQKTIFFTATLSCARDKVVSLLRDGITTSAASITSAQLDCIFTKLTDDDLVKVLSGDSDVLTTTVTACVTA
jgi:hypothetical protein